MTNYVLKNIKHIIKRSFQEGSLYRVSNARLIEYKFCNLLLEIIIIMYLV